MPRCIVATVFLTASVMVAQTYEVGASGGFGFTRNAEVTSPAGSGKAGLKNGAAAGGWLGFNDYARVGGEFHYMYRFGDFHVEGGGQKAGFGAESHLVYYEFLYHSAPRESRIRLFAAGGGGMRIYRGTGAEHAYQPASNFAWLTKTQEVKGLISAGGGVKLSLAKTVLLRVEFRDYITPFPKEVITPANGVKLKGWLHDFVPMAGIGVRF